MDNPLNDPNSTFVKLLSISDIVFSSIFAMEATLKIIAYGFFFNRNVAYLKNGWNVIDFSVVIISLISIGISGDRLKIIKIFRLFRVLRPLRVISRNKGLRIGIQALFMAVPNIINVIIVSLLFYIIFGIIGVNYFKGSFYSCSFGDEFMPDFLTPLSVFE
jgi:voltage-dependent calcium channel L type alpha-1D